MKEVVPHKETCLLATVTDLTAKNLEELDIQGNLLYAEIVGASRASSFADIYVILTVWYKTRSVKIKLIEGYVCGVNNDLIPGPSWSGRIPIDRNTDFQLLHYQASGENQRLDVNLVIERER